MVNHDVIGIWNRLDGSQDITAEVAKSQNR
jgi:hypothetical protein